jgi:hypothetical protein
VPTLHLLVVALQNELIEPIAQLRPVSQVLGGTPSIRYSDILNENSADFDLITEYNV